MSLPRAALAALALCPLVVGQVDMFRTAGKLAGDQYGWSVAGAGDVNGDGFRDFLVGAKAEQLGGLIVGRAYVLSGQDGSIIYDLAGTEPSARMGYDVASAGDVNKDGFDDLLLCSPRQFAGKGGVTLMSGIDGNILNIFQGALPGDGFGTSSAGLGDVDGDTFRDIVIGACEETTCGFGYVRVFSGDDFTLIHDIPGSQVFGALPCDRFGECVVNVGDVDEDGTDDIFIGVPGFDLAGFNQGMALIVSGDDATLIWLIFDGEPMSEFGSAGAALGDLDDDGVPDFAIGSPLEGPSTGRVRVYSGKTKDVLYTLTGTDPGERFGRALDNAGDVNDDGYDDLIVGAPFSDSVAPDAGRAIVFSGVDGQQLLEFTGDMQNDYFGQSVAGGVDMTNDGFPEFVMGANWNPMDGSQPGFARVVSSFSPWLDLGGGTGGVFGTPVLEGGTTLTPGTLTRLGLSSGAPNSATTLIIGLSAINAPLKGGLLVPAPDFLVMGLPTDSLGELEVTTLWPQGLPAGTELYFQTWITDPSGTQGLTSSNGLLGEVPAVVPATPPPTQ